MSTAEDSTRARGVLLTVALAFAGIILLADHGVADERGMVELEREWLGTWRVAGADGEVALTNLTLDGEAVTGRMRFVGGAYPTSETTIERGSFKKGMLRFEVPLTMCVMRVELELRRGPAGDTLDGSYRCFQWGSMTLTPKR
jgi:hypothetical protein